MQLSTLQALATYTPGVSVKVPGTTNNQNKEALLAAFLAARKAHLAKDESDGSGAIAPGVAADPAATGKEASGKGKKYAAKGTEAKGQEQSGTARANAATGSDVASGSGEQVHGRHGEKRTYEQMGYHELRALASQRGIREY